MTVQLQFKKEFYEAVPHLFVENGEIQLEVCKPEDKKADSILLNKQAKGEAVFLSVRLDQKSESQFHAFRQCIEDRGQQDPIRCDERGNVLDGYALWFAPKTLGIPDKNIKAVVVRGLGSQADRITWIRQRKLARHHLNEKQRMAIVQAEIKAHPKRAHNWHAKLLGVSYNTVAKYRKLLEADGEIEILESLRCSNGKTVSNKNPGKLPSQSGASTKPTKSPVDEAKEDAAMRDKGLTIPEIADKTEQNAEAVANRLKLLRLNPEKQKQVHEGKLDPATALKNQKNLIKQVEEELPSYRLLPASISGLWQSSDLHLALKAIDEFFRDLAGKDLNAFPPPVRQLLTEMVAFWSQKYGQLIDVLKETKHAKA